MRVDKRQLALLAALLLFVTGCDEAPAGTDAATTSDAAVDAGMVFDAGMSADGGPGLDAGTSFDAGPPETDAGRPDRPEDYPADPYADLTPVAGTPTIHRGTSTFEGGVAQFQVWAPPGYTRDVRWPLIVHLHGGGNRTNTTESLSSGAGDIRAFSSSADGDQFIWMAAVVRVSGSYHAWAMEANALDMIDAIREVSRLFRVDHTRVYLAGTSMGGGGVATLSYVIPDAFAAHAPVVGYYWNDLITAPDLSGLSFRVVAGELDRPPGQPFDRLALAQIFAMQTMDAGASVDFVQMTGVGHSYPSAEVGRTNAFFLAHTRDAPTDWAAVRADADAVLPLFSM